MLVLHALATADGRLALWAEDAGLPQRAGAGVGAHPFAVAGERLPEVGKVDVVSVLLPSYASGPAASPELVRDPLAAGPAPRGRLRLRAWQVPVVMVESAFSVAEVPGFRAGASLRFLGDVGALAEDLVARGRVLPSVAFGPSAQWQAALSGTDLARFTALLNGMPAAFRAEQVEPELRPAPVLHATVNALVDAEVRARLGERGVRLAPRRPGRPTLAESWLTALVEEPRFDAEPRQLGQFVDRLEAWHTSGLHDVPVRVCFRLRAPDHTDDTEDWLLEFLLQAVADPSVLVPAAEVWRGDDGVLHRWISEPQELLLAHLGRASRLFPALDTALAQSRPTHLVLDAGGAYEFLTHAGLLDQEGFGVLLPAWWQRPAELGLALTASSPGTVGAVAKESSLGLKNLVKYRWELALGEEKLTEHELAQLAKAKVPLVSMRGRWVHVDQKRLAAGMAFLARAGTGQATAGEVLLHAGLGHEEAGLPMPVTSVGGDGWLGDLMSGRVDQLLEPVEPPEGFTATLRPYQRRGLAWLALLDRLGLGACLADDMGLGKTVQLLALEALARAETRRQPTLLVCPMSVVGNWQREAARFAPTLSVYVHHGGDRLTGADLVHTLGEHDFVITTYALAARDVEVLSEVDWDRVVLDEAQNIKNSATRQAKAVRQLPARHRVALTGTPVENRLAELWSVMDFVNPGVLGSVNTFRARFAVPVERHGDEEAAARLRRTTGPFVLRRLKTDPTIIDDLPDKLEMKQLCTLTAEQASLYQAVVDDMLAKVGESRGIERKGLVLATMSKLKQVCNHPAQFLGDGSRIAARSGKVARLEEILDEVLAEGDRALCFTQFTEFGGMLVPHLAERFDREVLFLHGGTSKTARDTMVRRFQSERGPAIFLLSLKAGGTGLNLTAANHVIHVDRWWNPAVEDQATDRAFRIGQRRNVQVRKFVCIGTLEERIDQMIEEKKTLAQLAVGAGESWLTELSTTQLRELVTLSPEAVGE
ncbi:DEAD/DEAH box helicase [Solihabitans fulvus]|uniref:DEAD/DEAH box helicase n=1 Tax=Solihabitans fulvus TaxID=1892852 RepID=A0A5B2XDH5_9PSEU|nr:DEAD/DEAH box helicase [Solihabitans fulvus]KAA2261276.1 DEAD/DEAH box helicase [Solihabitans fulvus]